MIARILSRIRSSRMVAFFCTFPASKACEANKGEELPQHGREFPSLPRCDKEHRGVKFQEKTRAAVHT